MNADPAESEPPRGNDYQALIVDPVGTVEQSALFRPIRSRGRGRKRKRGRGRGRAQLILETAQKIEPYPGYEFDSASLGDASESSFTEIIAPPEEDWNDALSDTSLTLEVNSNKSTEVGVDQEGTSRTKILDIMSRQFNSLNVRSEIKRGKQPGRKPRGTAAEMLDKSSKSSFSKSFNDFSDVNVPKESLKRVRKEKSYDYCDASSVYRIKKQERKDSSEVESGDDTPTTFSEVSESESRSDDTLVHKVHSKSKRSYNYSAPVGRPRGKGRRGRPSRPNSSETSNRSALTNVDYRDLSHLNVKGDVAKLQSFTDVVLPKKRKKKHFKGLRYSFNNRGNRGKKRKKKCSQEQYTETSSLLSEDVESFSSETPDPPVEGSQEEIEDEFSFHDLESQDSKINEDTEADDKSEEEYAPDNLEEKDFNVEEEVMDEEADDCSEVDDEEPDADKDLEEMEDDGDKDGDNDSYKEIDIDEYKDEVDENDQDKDVSELEINEPTLDLADEVEEQDLEGPESPVYATEALETPVASEQEDDEDEDVDMDEENDTVVEDNEEAVPDDNDPIVQGDEEEEDDEEEDEDAVTDLEEKNELIDVNVNLMEVTVEVPRCDAEEILSQLKAKDVKDESENDPYALDTDDNAKIEPMRIHRSRRNKAFVLKSSLNEEQLNIEKQTPVELPPPDNLTSTFTNRPSRRKKTVSRKKLEDFTNEINSDSNESIGSTEAVDKLRRKSKRLSRQFSPAPIAIAAPGDQKPTFHDQNLYKVADESLVNLLCKCRVKQNPTAVSIKGDIYCQAVDSFDGRYIGCCNIVVNYRYLRVSCKVPFFLFCNIHRQRLRRHNCCPNCGLFCTQGVFYECRWDKIGPRHYYHKLCALQIGGLNLCPHCGTDQPPVEVHLELKLSRKPVIYLHQQQEKKNNNDLTSARITLSQNNEIEALPSTEIELAESEPTIDLGDNKYISASKMPPGLNKQSLLAAIDTINSGKHVSAKPSIKAIYWSCKQGDLEKLIYVLMNGISPNSKVKEYGNQSGLHTAATHNCLSAVHILVQAGAALDLTDSQLMSPLMHAIIRGHNEIVHYLIQAGASLLAKTEDGMTPLHLAAKSGNFDACKYIFDSGRLSRHAVNIQDEGGWSALVWASENKYINVVKLILDRGGNPQLCDVEQNTALHWAAFSGSTHICSMVLDRGCSLKAMNAHGDTPLHIAARQNHVEAVVLLLARGASLDILNSKGQSPVDCAIPESECHMQLALNKTLRNSLRGYNVRPEVILCSDIAAGKEQVPIPCINGVDDDEQPNDYLYLAENCEAANVNVDRTIYSLKWCECEDNCSTELCGCGQLNFQCWYDPEGRLLPDFNYKDPPMIFECNRGCRCNKLTCHNRVMQHGITAHLQLFKTEGKGWGVRALKEILKGSYVCEYVGEVITDLEADQRQDDSYLFDLDNRDSETYCLDARNYGNVARFINHLCEPNVTPVKVFIDHQDLRFPRIAFFANRNIDADEELGFDYGDKFWVIKYKQFTCMCKSQNCKYSVKAIHTTLERYNQKLKDLQERSSPCDL